MNRSWRVILVAILLCSSGLGCENSSVQAERLPDIRPNLPEVPQIPPPPHPVTYPDGTYSVLGVRRRSATTMDQDVSITGYIVEVYQPPACPRGESCPRPLSPHFWLADTADEAETTKRLQVVGYATSQEEVDAIIRQGTRRDPGPDGTIPPAIDFRAGNRVKVTGHFGTMSSAGFNASDGLIEYRTHQTLEAAAAQ